MGISRAIKTATLAALASLALLFALTFASGASANWYAAKSFWAKEVVWTNYRWHYANYAEVNSHSSGYVCVSGANNRGWQCGWNRQTNNWGYWNWSQAGCQNGMNYTLFIQCYDYDGR